ncbi:hypothetical protein [Neptunomonas phycophila]|uniref:hypothetical protein n=1 Tax=Neptunomonas phycophila TaxID=1572645 RepID=UPI003512549F
MKIKQKVTFIGIKCLAVSMVVLPSLAFAATDSLGDLMSGHGNTELKSWFSMALLVFAFVGFLVSGGCLLGMAMIKMAPNSPATQKFEQAGMGGLFMGAIIGGAIMSLGGLASYFMGTVLGDGADTGAFDRLKSSSMIESSYTPNTAIAFNAIFVVPEGLI